MPFLGVIWAIVLSLKEYPGSVQPDMQFSVTARLECSRCSDSYLRAVFFPSGTNYFGYTQNNIGDWVATTPEKTQYFLVSQNDIQSGTWSGQIKVRPDSQSPDYTGPGNYSFKLIRYTASGSKSAETDPVSIQIIGPTVAPSLLPPTPAPTIFHPTKVPSPTSTPKPQISPTPVPEVLSADFAIDTRTPATIMPSPTPAPDKPADPAPDLPNPPIFAWILIGLGIIGFGVGIFCFFWRGKLYT